MHISINNLENIKKKLVNYPKIKIIAVSKTFGEENIIPLLEYGHKDFGENKVQEALQKWSKFKNLYKDINLHMIGKLQTNKVKFAVKIFDYIHSVDSEKMAKKIADEQKKIKKKIKIFLQVNIGNEDQKSGIDKNNIGKLVNYCKEIDLDLIGLMCIPPANLNPKEYFEEMKKLNEDQGLNQLSMGMSSDYLEAAKYNSTYIRIGSSIFGKRH